MRRGVIDGCLQLEKVGLRGIKLGLKGFITNSDAIEYVYPLSAVYSSLHPCSLPRLQRW